MYGIAEIKEQVFNAIYHRKEDLITPMPLQQRKAHEVSIAVGLRLGIVIAGFELDAHLQLPFLLYQLHINVLVTCCVLYFFARQKTADMYNIIYRYYNKKRMLQ